MADYKEVKNLNEILTEDMVFDDFKNHIFARVFNKENIPFNISLDEIPYIKRLDLVITYYISFKTYIKENSGIKCYMIKNKDLKSWNLTEEDIYNIAFENHEKLNSSRVETITKHLSRHHVLGTIVNIPDNVISQFNARVSGANTNHSIFDSSQYGTIPIANSKTLEKEYDTQKENDILIISNRSMNFGSISMFMKDTLENVYKRFNENFYILPTSVHELLCIKQSSVNEVGNLKETEEDLLDMVEQINDKMISSSNDILSYNIYLYMHDEKCTLLIN